MNPIYNLLAAYSEIDKEIGYTQGMNFLVALILLAVDDEVLAFVLFRNIMQNLKWRQVYKDGLAKLFELSAKIKKWLISREKMIAVHIDCHGILLEA